MAKMIIGVDPHKASVTIEVVDQHGMLAATGRSPTARSGYQAPTPPTPTPSPRLPSTHAACVSSHSRTPTWRRCGC